MPHRNVSTDEERFLAKVRKEPDGCWTWLAAKNYGYGIFTIGPPWHSVRAHRWAYEHWVAPLVAGEPLHHECENPPCVNPAHLTPKTRATHGPLHRTLRATCNRDHPWTTENTHIDKRGNRHCRECQNWRAREARKQRGPKQPKPARTHCANGHLLAEHGRLDEKGRYAYCRICAAAKDRAKRRAAGVPLGNARKTHCKHGHPFDETNTYVYAAGRRCRTCDRLRHAG